MVSFILFLTLYHCCSQVEGTEGTAELELITLCKLRRINTDLDICTRNLVSELI